MSHDAEAHYRALERMYQAAPINALFGPTLRIERGTASIEAAVDPQPFHAAGAVHGSVYFKMLDDAAFFAAGSLEPEVFVLTASFTIYLTRPVSSGRLRAVGKVLDETRSGFIAESTLSDDQGRTLARGSGSFARSRIPLREVASYAAHRSGWARRATLWPRMAGPPAAGLATMRVCASLARWAGMLGPPRNASQALQRSGCGAARGPHRSSVV